MVFSCKFSLKPIHWIVWASKRSNGMANPTTTSTTHSHTDSDKVRILISIQMWCPATLLTPLHPGHFHSQNSCEHPPTPTPIYVELHCCLSREHEMPPAWKNLSNDPTKLSLKFNLPMENHLYSYRQIKSIRFDSWNYHRNHTGT